MAKRVFGVVGLSFGILGLLSCLEGVLSLSSRAWLGTPLHQIGLSNPVFVPLAYWAIGLMFVGFGLGEAMRRVGIPTFFVIFLGVGVFMIFLGQQPYRFHAEESYLRDSWSLSSDAVEGVLILGGLVLASICAVIIMLRFKDGRVGAFGPSVTYVRGQLVCGTCGTPIRLALAAGTPSALWLMGFFGALLRSANLQCECPKCGRVNESNLPLRYRARLWSIQIGLFLLACFVFLVIGYLIVAHR
jgi:hypothetical protein